MRKLLLFSGLGADARLFSKIAVPGVQVVAVDHLEPAPAERFEDYVARLRAAHPLGPDDLVGGSSFGGMLAAEYAKQQPVAGLILLGTCLRTRELPGYYRALSKGARFLPDALLARKPAPRVMRRLFGPLDGAALELFLTMVEACPPSRLKGFARMLADWPGVRPAGAVLSVHGKLDKVLPVALAEPGVVLEDAGHALVLSHPAAVNTALAGFLPRL